MSSTEINIALLFAVFLVALICLLFFFRSSLNIQQPKGQFFQSDLGPIYYEVLGQKGPYILLIHGIGASSFCWRKVSPLLAQNFRVIMVDLWGFGRSTKSLSQEMTLDQQANILFYLLCSLQIQKCHLVGHSMGGQIGFWMSLKFPHLIDKIIAVAPASHPALIKPTFKRLLWTAHWTPLFFHPKTMKRILNYLFIDSATITDEVLYAYYKPYEDSKAHKSFAAALNLIEDKRVFESLENIKQPVALIWGEKDAVVDKSKIMAIAQKLKPTQIKTHPQSGHMLMEDDPSWLTEAILGFLKS